MGAINPNNSVTKSQLAISQKLTKSMLLMISSYYKAHAIIEDAVLAEGKKSKKVLFLVENAKNKFISCNSHAIEVKENIENSVIEFKHSNQWKIYLKEVNLKNNEIISELSTIDSLINASSVTDSIKAGAFQDSMWGENINSTIRKISVKCSSLLSELMIIHGKFVEETHVHERLQSVS